MCEMIKATMRDLLEGRLDDQDTHSYYLYIVRDEEVVFYVGQSCHGVVNRLWQHLGRGSFDQGLSWLGRVIEANLPISLDWIIELREPRHKTHEYFHSQLDIDDTEKELIEELRPCLNVIYNSLPSPLPELYNNLAPDLETTVSDFIPF